MAGGLTLWTWWVGVPATPATSIFCISCCYFRVVSFLVQDLMSPDQRTDCAPWWRPLFWLRFPGNDPPSDTRCSKHGKNQAFLPRFLSLPPCMHSHTLERKYARAFGNVYCSGSVRPLQLSRSQDGENSSLTVAKTRHNKISAISLSPATALCNYAPPLPPRSYPDLHCPRMRNRLSFHLQ